MCETCRLLLSDSEIVGPLGKNRTDAIRRPQLGNREVEVVVAWLVHGTKARAAPVLYVEESTVKTTIERVREKYAAVGRPAPTQVALLIRLVQDGVIDLGRLVDVESGRQETPRRATDSRGSDGFGAA